MIRVSHRVGRRTWVSTPLWAAIVGYLLWVSLLAALAVAVVALLLATALLYLLVLGAGRLGVGVRRRFR